MTPFPLVETIRDCTTCDLRTRRMFCNLDEPALSDYARLGSETSYPKGTILFREEGPCQSVHILCTGQVKLSCTSKEGKTLVLKIAMPGDVLGLAAALSGSPHEVTAETLAQTQVKSIRRADFLLFIKRHGEVSLNAARALSEEYKSAFFDARRLALSGSAAARLASVLMDWGKGASSCGTCEMRFSMALTHEELGALVGSSRETITRTLSRFKREKLIQMRGSSILILAPKLLEQLAV